MRQKYNNLDGIMMLIFLKNNISYTKFHDNIIYKSKVKI